MSIYNIHSRLINRKLIHSHNAHAYLLFFYVRCSCYFHWNSINKRIVNIKNLCWTKKVRVVVLYISWNLTEGVLSAKMCWDRARCSAASGFFIIVIIIIIIIVLSRSLWVCLVFCFCTLYLVCCNCRRYSLSASPCAANLFYNAFVLCLEAHHIYRPYTSIG